MNNKTLMVAGISALAISALSISAISSITNAANVSSNTLSAHSQSFKGMEGGIKDERFGLGREKGLRGENGSKGMFGGMQNSVIKAAIDANDYNAFVTARKADTNKPSDATQPTQEQFNQIASHSNKQIAVEAALKSNDYDSYVKVTTPTKEEFAKQVTEYKTHTAIDTAIKAKDYTAFVSAIKLDINRSSDTKIPTQDEFNSMVARSIQTTTKK